MWICLALFNVILIVFIITYLWSQMSNAISTTKLLNNCWFEALRQKKLSTLSLSEQLLTTPARPPVLILRPTLVSLLLLGLFFSSSVSSRPLLLRFSAASGLRQLLCQLLLILDSENIALPSNTHLNMKLKGRKLSDTWETNHLQQQGRPLQLAIC